MLGLFAFACFGIGAALSMAALSAFRRRRRMAAVGSPREGRVLSVERITERAPSGGRSALYLMRVEYESPQGMREAELRFSSPPKYAAGGAIALLVDAEDPSGVLPADGAGDKRAALALALVSLAFIALGAFFVIAEAMG